MQDRRKDIRVPMRAQVICVADSRTSRGVTSNLSQSGIQVVVPELRKTAKVQLTFRLPLSNTIIEAHGAVVWISGSRLGIKFKQMREQTQASIRHFIEQRSVQGQ
jgi:c-di-GMP-binding flagellar brake protein YcgR